MRILFVLGLAFTINLQPVAAQSAIAASGTSEAGGRSATMTLSPGDAVRITVWRKEELCGEFAVAAERTIASPVWG
jgi:protein involved in polysaccharide export with SLBB domain